jgi:hypothetical protein
MNPTLRTGLYALGGVVVLLIVIAIGFYYYEYYSPTGKQSSLQNSADYLLVSAGAPPFSAVSRIDLSNGSTTAVTLAGSGNSQIISEVRVGTTSVTYYLLSQPGAAVTNLYKVDSSQPKVGLQQLTFSQTFKYALSVDSFSGSAVYAIFSAASPNSPQIMAYSAITKKETSLGAGNMPSLLHGGSYALYTLGGRLVSGNIDTGKTYTLYPVSSSTPYAVDNTNNTIALYMPQTQSIQYYSIANQITPIYMRSVKMGTSTPLALFYDNGSLYMVSNSASKNTQLQVSMLGGPSSSTTYTLPTNTLITGNTELSIQHE